MTFCGAFFMTFFEVRYTGTFQIHYIYVVYSVCFFLILLYQFVYQQFLHLIVLILTTKFIVQNNDMLFVSFIISQMFSFLYALSMQGVRNVHKI